MGLAKKPAAASRGVGPGRTRLLLVGLLAFLIGVLLLISPAFLQKGLAKEEVRVPAAALQAIREAFPQAILGEVGLEDDDRVTLLMVEAKTADTYLEIIVSPDGTVIEVLKWPSVTETRDKGPKKQPKAKLNRGKAQCPAAQAA